MIDREGIDAAALRENIRLGVEWLKSPRSCGFRKISHLGEHFYAGGGVHGSVGCMVGEGHLSLSIGVVNHGEWNEYRPEPMSEQEGAAVKQYLEELGCNVINQWRHNHDGYSYRWDNGVSQAIKKLYGTKYCEHPKPKNVIVVVGNAMDRKYDTAESCKICKSPERVNPERLPSWVRVADPGPQVDPAVARKNAAVARVEEVLAKYRPLLADAGVHAATVLAGALGDIEDGDFVERDAGLGVAVPPEVFELLADAYLERVTA